MNELRHKANRSAIGGIQRPALRVILRLQVLRRIVGVPANSASASAASVYDCVSGSEFMAANAMRFAGMLRCDTFAPQAIFAMRDSFKMRRVYASAIAAKMVDFVSGWNGAFCKFVGESVRRNGFPVHAKFAISSKASVRCHPWPTRLSAFRSVCFIPKSLHSSISINGAY